MTIRKLLLIQGIIVLSFSNVQSQDWSSYTNSNNVSQIAFDSDLIWGATSGGIINFSIVSDEINKLTNTDGLGGIDYNCAEVDTAGDLWFGAEDGWLSKILDTGDIINYPVVED